MKSAIKVNVFFLVYMQGEYVESCHVERPHQTTALRWHPTKPLLAIGWENGEVVLLTYPSGDQTVIPSTHTACMLLLDWSSSGSRLVTGDQVCCSDDFILLHVHVIHLMHITLCEIMRMGKHGNE